MTTTFDPAATRVLVLDAAEALFYARGIQNVGMDEVRSAAGVPLKRLYQLYASKNDLVEAYLRRRDGRWLESLAAFVEQRTDGQERVLAVFDWLCQWLAEPDFRGCAFVNAYGELGATTPSVAHAVDDHKTAFRHYLIGLTTAAGATAGLGEQLTLLAEGAMTTAAISGSVEPGRHARDAARVLLAATWWEP